MAGRCREIDYRTVLIEVEEKVRGSRARRLGDALEARFGDGYDQVILDLRACASLDSVGALALLGALEMGQRLYLVLEPGIAADELLPPELAGDPRFDVFDDPAEAIRSVRAREESGLLVLA